MKKGLVFDETDYFGYNVVKVQVHDFQKTIGQLPGIDHQKLILKSQGRYYRLTDVHGKLAKLLLA